MMRGMFSAISGLKQHQVMLDVTANDIANVNTVGYKSSRVTFQDSLNQLQRGAAGANAATGGTNAAQVGLGVKLGSIDNLMSNGSSQTTGSPLDVSITGEGFFQIGEGNPAGAANAPINPTSYTRAGNFSVSTAGYLTNSAGQYVVGYQLDPGTGNPITTGVRITVSITRARPTPVPEVAARPKPRPVSATVTASLPCTISALTVSLPPSALGSRPCLMAFSTRPWIIIGGNSAYIRPSGTSISVCNRSSMRTFRISR